MPAETAPPSARRTELLDAAYRYVLTHGIAELSLRPLAAAIGSSPRVLLFLFGSKDGLVRELLGQARADQLALVRRVRAGEGTGLAAAVAEIWGWLAAAEHRPLLTLWAEAYSRSLAQPEGAWAGFARGTVEDWLAVLAGCVPGGGRDAPEVTLALAVLRGALLDLLATGDRERIDAALRRQAAVFG